jgi:hypothetical protein
MFVSHFILSVIKTRTVNLSKLSQAFETNSLASSNYKRLQRFFRLFIINMDDFTRLIITWLPEDTWVLCMDRTNWKIGKTNVNILVIAVAYKKIAIPLLWCFLNKKGNSNTQERIEIMNRYIELFGVKRINYFTGDREFIGEKWVKYLQSKGISFHIRVPKSTMVSNRHGTSVFKITRLFSLKNNEIMMLNSPRKLWNVLVYVGALRTEEGFVIIISDKHASNLVKDYLVRWEIETLFVCLKTKGFNLEDTKIRDPERLSKLFALLTITFIGCYRVGEWDNDLKPIRILTHKRPAQTLFSHGLNILNRIALNSHLMLNDFIKYMNLIFHNEKLRHVNLN